VPDVVWLLVLGIVIGPNMLGLAHATEAVDFLRELGLGFLFLLAGFEVNTSDMRSRAGRSTALTWLLCMGLGVGAGLLITAGDWQEIGRASCRGRVAVWVGGGARATHG